MDRHKWIPSWNSHLKTNPETPLMCGAEFTPHNWTGNDKNVTCDTCILLLFAAGAENDDSFDRGEPSERRVSS